MHTAGADGRCVECGQPFPCPATLAAYAAVVPRRRSAVRICTACQTGPMHHPEHRWEPCWVRLPGGDECGCTIGVRQPPESS